MPRIPKSQVAKRAAAEEKHESRRKERNFCPPAIEESTSVAVEEAPPAKPRKITPPAPSAPIPESVARRNAEIRDAEELLLRLQDGEQLDPSEESFLAWIWPAEADMLRQRQRVAKLRKYQRDAATSDVRDEAQAKAAEASEQLEAEGQRLRDEIAKAQAELASLERAAEHAAAVVAGHNIALDALHDAALLNDVDKIHYQRIRRTWEADYGSPARSLRTQAEAFLQRADWTPDDNSTEICQYAQASRGLGHLVTIRTTQAPTPATIRSWARRWGSA